MNQTAHVEHTPCTSICIQVCTYTCTYMQTNDIHTGMYIYTAGVCMRVYMHCTHRHTHLTYMKNVLSNTVLEWTYSFKDKVIACHRGLQGKDQNRYIKFNATISTLIPTTFIRAAIVIPAHLPSLLPCIWDYHRLHECCHGDV